MVAFRHLGIRIVNLKGSEDSGSFVFLSVLF